MIDTQHNERVHVAVPPMPSVDTRLLKAMSKITGQLAYDLRLKLKGGYPKSIMLCPTLPQAEAVADRLRDLGLTTIVYRQDDLPPQVPFAVHKLGLKDSTLKVADRRGHVRTIAVDEIALMVYGRREIHSTHAEFKCTPRIRLGGIGGFEPTTEDAAEAEQVHRVEREDFCVLFPNDPCALPVELGVREMAYDSRKDGIRCSKQHKHRVLVTQLREALTHVPFDDRLMKAHCGNHFGEAFFNRGLTADSSWACATLIYWEMLAERKEPKHFNGSTRGGAD